MNPQLETYIEKAKEGFDQISETRKNEIEHLVSFFNQKLKKEEKLQLVFVCTHNSRRSHLCQIWAHVAAAVYNLEDKIECFSAGTEVTALNPRVVSSLERAGFEVINPGGENPEYKIVFDQEKEPILCFSKRYDDASIPKEDFIAIMTCGHAEENCPFLPGAIKRQPLTFRDPKESDDTNREAETYDERCLQIASEMLFMISKLEKENATV